MKTIRQICLMAALVGTAVMGVIVMWPTGSVSARPTGNAAVRKARGLVLDDFKGEETSSVDSARNWQLVTDRVMGGRSDGRISVEREGERFFLRLTGRVSTANQGGFIQARRMLGRQRQGLDASGYDGVRLWARGNGRRYALHLRTRDTQRPWSYYGADFRADENWREITLSFLRFRPYAVDEPLDPRELVSVAVAAVGKEEFEADIQIDRIELYRKERTPMDELTEFERYVLLEKGTERAGTGEYTDWFEQGVYACKRCRTPLFESGSKFHSGCGWPSFDEALPDRVKRQPDADGVRVEIVCASCGGHLGHVFEGEQMTAKNTRHCVNSVSLVFIPQAEVGMERAIFAAGCFWGVQHWLDKAEGVVRTRVGYTGGHVLEPTYKQVCTGTTGHAEAVEVIYDPAKTSYEAIARLFFETHDFTQADGQGPDIGHQYRSGIFYLDEQQKAVAEKLIGQLRQMGYDVKTEVTPAKRFWPAEDYHQDYYEKKGQLPYCHAYRKIF